jgi:hypothetical protein
MDMGFEADSEDDDVECLTTPSQNIGPPELPLLGKDEFITRSVKQYKLYKTACKQLPWKRMFPDPKYQIGVPGVNWQELTYEIPLQEVWKKLDALNYDGQFGYLVTMARHSKASVYKLQASSFCERVNSAGKIVFNDSNLRMSSEKVEKRTMLRMNRKWMLHMRQHYPECTPHLMLLLRQSHDALNPVESSESSSGEAWYHH